MSPARAVLIVQTAGVRFALDGRHVLSVRGVPQTTPLPRSPTPLLGVFHHDGKVLPLFDLIAYAQGDPQTERPRVVIVQADEQELGLLVEDVLEMLPLPHTELDEDDDGLPPELARIVQGRLRPRAGPVNDLQVEASETDERGEDEEPELRRRLEEILEGAPEWLRRIHLQDGNKREAALLQRAQETLSSDPPVHLVHMKRLVKALGRPLAAPAGGAPA